jgi:hypothetical protein
MLVLAGALKGRGSYRLSELDKLPDEKLAQIRPMVNPEYEIFVDQGYLCARSRRPSPPAPPAKSRRTAGEGGKLFTLERENLAVFNRFDGQHSLAEIGREASAEMGWDEAAGFERARDVFLSLVGRLVCVPSGPLEFDE